MAAGTRSSKRKRTESETSSPAEAPTKSARKGRRAPETSAEPEPGKEARKPTSHPFVAEEVEWTYVRLDILGVPKKVIPAGYEGLAGEVNDVLKTLSIPQADKVRNSAMGQFTRLDNNCTRSGNMLHYVVSQQVIPEPNFDPTALFFKVGWKVLRFSRNEYALVSGLKFGPTSFNPYTPHELPPNSIYSRLFGENEGTRLYDVRAAYTSNKFKVNGKQLRATSDDFVKLSKFLLCPGFALGFDGSKKKIPKWLWVLLENESEWEESPWGSISYQVLFDAIMGIPPKAKSRGKTMNYTFKGNTVAFSAWIFEAIPAFGEIVGLKKDERCIPRFMRYSYAKERGYPTDEQIKKRLVRVLKPHTDEKAEGYWKSLEFDPAPHPFAFKYDPTESMKKKGRLGNKGEDLEEANPAISSVTGFSNTQLEAVVDAAVRKCVEQMKTILEDFKTSWSGDIAEQVATMILEKADNDNSHHAGHDAFEYMDPVADTQTTVPPMPPFQSTVANVSSSTPATTTVVAVEKTVTAEGGSLFSLGSEFDPSQPSQQAAAAKATATTTKEATTPTTMETPSAAAAPVATPSAQGTEGDSAATTAEGPQVGAHATTPPPTTPEEQV